MWCQKRLLLKSIIRCEEVEMDVYHESQIDPPDPRERYQVEGSETGRIKPIIGMSVREMQAVNKQRANRWHGNFESWSGLEWAGALCGEAGEAANIAKKLKRIESNIDGNVWSEHPLQMYQLKEKLASECADTFLYLTLLASRYGIDLEEAIVDKFNAKSKEMGFPERMVYDTNRQ